MVIIKTIFFKQDPLLSIRTAVLMTVSIAFMLLDQHNDFFHRIRTAGAVVTMPIDYLVSSPISFYHNFRSEWMTHQRLIAENSNLKAQQILLKSQLQKLIALQAENEQLQALLQSAQKTKARVLKAQLLAVMPNPYLQQLIINKGKRNNVFIGQPVIDAYGVVGQVVHVEPFKSRVMLITNLNSSIPVQDSRTEVRAIAVGNGVGKLTLQGITETASIKVGDIMITSGLGGRYSYGYPVGRVVNVRHRGGQFSQVTLEPMAHLARSRLMLLLWPQSESSKLPLVQINRHGITVKHQSKDHDET